MEKITGIRYNTSEAFDRKEGNRAQARTHSAVTQKAELTVNGMSSLKRPNFKVYSCTD